MMKALLLLALFGCGAGQPLADGRPPDAPDAVVGVAACASGSVRCNGLTTVQRCVRGRWVTQFMCVAPQVCLSGECVTP